MKRVLPKDYRLFQVADLVCTIELTKKKMEHGQMSKSEKLIFHSKKDFYRDFVKRLEKKKLEAYSIIMKEKEILPALPTAKVLNNSILVFHRSLSHS